MSYEVCLSLQQYPVRDSHNINNGMRAADGSGDTLGLQNTAPSRDMRYLINITNKFHVATRTHHHLLVRIQFKTRTCRENKAPHAPMYLWLTYRRLAWSFKCIAVCYGRWVWRPKPGQQKKTE